MGFTALHILCLVPAFTLTTQELVGLSVSPRVTADCGKRVTLPCKVSSTQNGLSIKHLEWSTTQTSLCAVNSEGQITHNRSLFSDFHCEYEEGQLSLIFQKAQPLKYLCKLRSNKGIHSKYTTVELQECGQITEAVLTSKGPACTFNDVYPDGDVHWFHGSHNLSAGYTETSTAKSVDEGGRLIIQSYLKEGKSSDVPYNCSLRSSKSGRYIASALVEIPEDLLWCGKSGSTYSPASGVRSQETMGTLLYISVLLAVTLK
ncbi:uncharacterized protein LOC111659737 [Seriola lalandi dorsalis]|uniref:uncharacterized protein LOC111659737 n=1 Tax=Seriola lalandi dorsalis TaxID=1841481 RepID=UPI000C6F8F14|nr:uncharacterized protein LOC111659737 [Seriola lalandi dorsalis]